MNKTIFQNKANSESHNTIEKTTTTENLSENGLYWLYSSENFLLVKLTKIIELKEIYFKEQEITIIENKIKISEKNSAAEKKIAIKEKHFLKTFSKNQLDFKSDNLLDTADTSYPSILFNLKLKLQEGKKNFIKAGKIFLGINLVSASKGIYEAFVKKSFNLRFDSQKKISFIVNGLPNTGKSEIVKAFIRKIIGVNFFNYYTNKFNNNVNNVLSNENDNDNGNNNDNISNNGNFSYYNEESKVIDNRQKAINLINNDNFFDSDNYLIANKAENSMKQKLQNKIFTFIELLDLFGNTVENKFRMNCSRYMRIIKFYYPNSSSSKSFNNAYVNNSKTKYESFSSNLHSEENLKKIKLKHFLFEKNRILNKQENQFYFHIVHAVFHGLQALLSNNNIKNNDAFFRKEILALYPDYAKHLSESFGLHADFIADIVANKFNCIYKKFNFFAFNNNFNNNNDHDHENYFDNNNNKNNDSLQDLNLSDDNQLSINNNNNKNNAKETETETENENEELIIIKFFKEKFALLLRIFSDISLHKKIVAKIFNFILLLFYFKELQFSVDSEEKVFFAQAENEKLQKIFSLMNLELEDEKGLLIKKLTAREIVSPSGSFYLIKYSLEEANREKDNLVKFFYENLFKFIEKLANLFINYEQEKLGFENLKFENNKNDNCINNFSNVKKEEFNFFNFFKNFKQEKNEYNYLQLIECFGFENSADGNENNLENLIINYSNDKINNIFFDSLVKNELETYESEGIISNITNKSSNSVINSTNENLFNQLAKKFLRKQIINTSSTVNNDNNLNINNNKERNSAVTSSKRNSVIGGRPNFSANSGLLEQDIEKTISTCEDTSKGIFSIINSQSVLIKNNKGLISTLINNIKANWPEISVTPKSFFLQHIGGSQVEYGGEDFILRNTDFVKEDLKVLFKDLFTNLVGLSLKNYGIENETGFNYFWKITNLSSSEKNPNNNNINNNNNNKNNNNKIFNSNDSSNLNKNNERKPRGSAYGKPGGFTRKKFHCEVFMRKFKNIISSIADSELSIVKLLKTGNEKEFNTQNNLSLFDSGSKENKLSGLVKNYENLNFSFAAENDYFKIQNLNDAYKNKFYYDFENKFFLKQIYSSGILESIMLEKSGFFFRSSFENLKNKLQIFRTHFDFLEKNEIKENKNQQKNFDWTPNKQFIEKVSKLISVKEEEIVIGKSCVFLQNQAIISRNHNHYFKLKDFGSLVVFGIFKILIRKVKNAVKVLRIVKGLIMIRKCEIFLFVLFKVFKKRKLKSLLVNLNRKISFYVEKVKILQKNFRVFICKINKVKIIQRNLRVFVIKKKIENKKAAGRRIFSFADFYYKRNIKFTLKESFEALKSFIKKRNKCVESIKKHFNIFLKNKKTEKLFLILQSTINSKIKKKLLSNLIMKATCLSNIIKIQSKFRSIQAKNEHAKLALINLNRKKLLEDLIKIQLIAKYNKKVFRNLIHKLNNYIQIKNSKAIQIQQKLKRFLINKRIKKENNALKALQSLNDLFNKKYLNAKKMTTKILNEQIKKSIFAKKNEYAVKITSLLSRNKAVLKVKQLKKIAKKEKEEKLFKDLSLFENKVFTCQSHSTKQTFFQKFIQFNDCLLKRNENAVKIQALFRMLKAIKVFKQKSFLNKNLNLLIKKIKKCEFALKAKSTFASLITYKAFIIQRNQSAIKIQSLIRRKNSLIKYKSIKNEEDTMRYMLAEKFNKLISKIQNYEKQNTKLNSLNKLNEFWTQQKIKEIKAESAIKLQAATRKRISSKKLIELQEEKKREDLIILNKKCNLFFEKIFVKINENSNKKISLGFLNQLKKHAENKQNSAITLQKSFRSLIASRKSKALKLQNSIAKVIKKQAKANCFNALKSKYKKLLSALNNSAIKIQSLVRIKAASNKLKQIKKEAINTSIIKSSGKLNLIIFNNSLENQTYLSKLKMEFLTKLKRSSQLIISVVKIQSFYKKLKLINAAAKKLQNNLKALTKLDKTFDKKSFLSKSFLANQIKEDILMHKINQRVKQKKIIKIQKTFKSFLKLQKQKQIEKLISLQKQKLNLIFIKTESKKSFNFLKNYFLKFKHSLKIRNIVKIFCNKVHQKHTSAKYLKKLAFFTMQKAYYANKDNIFMKKLFLKYSNPYFKKLKSDFISTLRVASKYFHKKISKEAKQEKIENSLINENKKIINLKTEKNSTNNINVNESFNDSNACDNKNLNNLSDNLHPRLSAKIKPSSNYEKIKILKIEKIEKKNSSSKNLLLQKNENKLTSACEADKRKSEKNLNTLNSTVSDFDFFAGSEFKLFKFDRNLLKGFQVTDAEERVFKYNAANNLISKYSRASHKISTEIANERKSAFGAPNTFNKNAFINDSNNNNNNGMTNKDSGRLSTSNLNTSSRTSLNSNLLLGSARNTANKVNKASAEAQINGLLAMRKSAIITNKVKAAARLIVNSNINNNNINNNNTAENFKLANAQEAENSSRNFEVPSYKDLVHLSTGDFAYAEREKLSSRKTVAYKPKSNLLEKSNFASKENSKINSTAMINSNNNAYKNNYNKKVQFESSKDEKNTALVNSEKTKNNKNDELFDFKVNKRNSIIKKNNYNSSATANNNNNNNSNYNYNKKDDSVLDITERIEAVFKNLDKLTLLKEDKNNDDKDCKSNLNDCENYDKELKSEGSKHSHNFQRVCMSDYLKNKK